MNLFELLALVFVVGLTFLFGRFLFPYVGWWAVLPAFVLGFGMVAALLAGLKMFLGHRRDRAIGLK